MADTTWDDIDRFYTGRFDEEIIIGGSAYRGIVSRIGTTEPPVPAGLQTAQTLSVRVRKSEVATRPAVRTTLTTEDGAQYRIMGADQGSTGQEWVLTCTQEVTPT